MRNLFTNMLLASFLAITFAISPVPAKAAGKVLTISMDAGNVGQDSFNPFTTS